MKKFLTTILSILMVATLCLPSELAYGVTVLTDGDEEFEITGPELESETHFVGSDVTSNKTIASAIDFMMVKYKNESVFPGNGELCVAFANKFNSMIASSNKTTQLYNKRVSDENYKKYIMGCKPGTMFRLSYGPKSAAAGHTIIVLKATRDTVWWAECNRGGHNVIHYYKQALPYFIGHNGYFPYLTAVIEPVKYKTYSTINITSGLNQVTSEREIAWTNLKGANSYDIYRASSKNGTYQKIDTTENTSFSDSSAELGKTYYYKVKATASGKTSAAKKVTYSKLNAPYLHAKIEGNTATIYWDKVNGADKYKVYESDWGSDKLLSDQTATSYTIKLTDDKENYGDYVVKAICSSNSKQNSPYSQAVGFQYYNDDLKPQLQATTSSDGTVQLSWSSYGDRYTVYKAVKKLGRYYKVATIENGSTTTWKDTCGKEGEKYYYYIENDHYDMSIIASAEFTNATNTTKEYEQWHNLIANAKLETPKVTYEISEYGVRLNWDEVPWADGYTVTRKDLETGKVKELNFRDRSCLDKNAIKDNTYIYKVTAEGPELSFSKTKSVKVTVDVEVG